MPSLWSNPSLCPVDSCLAHLSPCFPAPFPQSEWLAGGQHTPGVASSPFKPLQPQRGGSQGRRAWHHGPHAAGLLLSWAGKMPGLAPASLPPGIPQLPGRVHLGFRTRPRLPESPPQSIRTSREHPLASVGYLGSSRGRWHGVSAWGGSCLCPCERAPGVPAPQVGEQEGVPGSRLQPGPALDPVGIWQVNR